MAPDRKRGYGLVQGGGSQQIGRYEFWAFDVAQRKLLSRTPFDGRPRMALRVSSNGKLLYVFQAGATIDVYDAATYKQLRTIEMNADQTTSLFILPRAQRPCRPRTAPEALNGTPGTWIAGVRLSRSVLAAPGPGARRSA